MENTILLAGDDSVGAVGPVGASGESKRRMASSITTLPVLIIAVASLLPGCSGYIIYHKPALNGRVLDADTKAPIEGVVAVAAYWKNSIGLSPTAVEDIVEVKEAVTDAQGYFHIPCYTTITGPLSWEMPVHMVMFKGGYGPWPRMRIRPPNMMNVHTEEFFSNDIGAVKKVLVRTDPWKQGAPKVTEDVAFGIVELPRLKTREEREKAIPSPLGASKESFAKQKEFMRAIKEEVEYLFPGSPGRH